MNTSAQDHSNTFKKEFRDFFLGTLDGRGVLLRVPSFDCGWYWGFGYLGNKNIHFHLNGLDVIKPELRRLHMHDQLIGLFGDSLRIKDKALWTFCEIVLTVYTLKGAAEVFGRGGSHTTTNPDADSLKTPDMVKHINDILIPMQIRTLWALLDSVK